MTCSRLRPITDGGQDFGGHLNDPASLAAGLTPQALNASRSVKPSRATRTPLACSITTRASKARRSWLASSPRSSLCMVFAMVRAARSVKATKANSPSGDQGCTLAENTPTTTPMACWL